jgi:hypothetical protein
MLRWIEIAIICLSIGFAFGYYKGRVSVRNVVITAQKNQMKAADLASTKEAQRLAAEAVAADLAQQLEDAANAQVPIAVCLPADRVLRLNQR